MRLLSKVRQYAAEHGDRYAFISEKGNLTYRELWEGSGRLAASLNSILKDDKTPVVVYGHKQPGMILYFMACVRSGRAYCPVDISMPKKRITDIIKKSGCRIVLAEDEIQCCGPRVITRKQADLIIKNSKETIDEKFAVRGSDDFYVIFTSGSTGAPKGVRITADNLDHFLRWSAELTNEEGQTEENVFLNQAPFSFDLSVMDLYTCLYKGGTLRTVDKETQADMKQLMKKMSEGKFNHWVSTPSFAAMCCSDHSFDQKLLPELKEFIFCGETLTNSLAGELMDRFPNTKIINTYGPTETTVAVTSVEITREMISADEPLPVGKPAYHTEIKTEEETGEIVITGDTVSAGYFKDEKQTARAFTAGRNRSYHTGDKGFIKNGMLHFSGRLDDQIKYHGYRIELGDIENNLQKIQGISDALVLPKEKDGAVKSLVAIVSGLGVPENSFQEGKKIKNKLKEKLPEYMVPKKIVFLDSMPVTANGKADRKILRELI
ncbi:MAG: D-alanine--poly(phosphoribitol) ligase subunit DltA [Eubacteriaceae bacterium]|nr:D-alanine--poly(phosphoribitol) ligase subunit DltA [Eubacteriaceae bacterium]